jgi:hypothetical protein
MTSMVMIRYQTRPDAAALNQELIEKVFSDLNALDPGRMRYMSFRLADGVSFVHIGIFDGDSPLAQLTAFQEFQAGLADRVVESPTRTETTLIGSYGFGG